MAHIVWRMEDAHGTGVYQMHGLIPYDHFNVGGKHLAPFEDFVVSSAPKYADRPLSDAVCRNCYYKFGFSSLEQARSWFDIPEVLATWVGRLFFVAYVVNKDEIIETPHQCIFNCPHIKTRVLFQPDELHTKEDHELVAKVLTSFR